MSGVGVAQNSFAVINNVSYWRMSKVFNKFMENELDTVMLEEVEEEEDVVDDKIAILADWIQNASSCIFFTGAGISTSSGIPDYRGPNGCWTQFKLHKELPQPPDLLTAVPTFTHQAIKSLIDQDLAEFVVTVNIDGLHRKVGLKARSQLVELHGCIFTERCTSCRQEFERDYIVRKMTNIHDHRVGECSKCGSQPSKNDLFGYCKVETNAKDTGTIDTIINFAEHLDNEDVSLATSRCEDADLIIVVGTSMSLRHISELPFLNKKLKGGKVVMINLQPTQDDDLFDLRIFAKSDSIFKKLLPLLNVQGS